MPKLQFIQAMYIIGGLGHLFKFDILLDSSFIEGKLIAFYPIKSSQESTYIIVNVLYS